MYIAEIAPRSVRGKLVSLNQLTTVLGILSAQIVNMLIAESVAPDATVADIAASWNGTMGWRWMFYAVCFPSFLFFVLVFFIKNLFGFIWSILSSYNSNFCFIRFIFSRYQTIIFKTFKG